MNYTAILDALGQASLFQLYRLNAAITNQLDDPARIAAVKGVLRIGQTLRWFDSAENRLVEAKLVSVNRTRARVQNVADGKIWNIPFYFIDLDGQDVAIAAQKRQRLDRNSLRVGDRVGFKDGSGQERFGQVVKLNQKSASVQVDAMRWRVSYGLLLSVFDGTLGDEQQALPGQWIALTDEAEGGGSVSLPGQLSFCELDDDDDDDPEFA
ncbi:hypothetical protein [uncultured Thiodictyon sp.]|uniref:hypothetical protein n=1 Tax=uncultured Thiodictyon sp. TaxID=1846217 RepID=UPI0025F2CCC8|nr:hypothetical protein [uncultured Thiodictyon sp.]